MVPLRAGAQTDRVESYRADCRDTRFTQARYSGAPRFQNPRRSRLVPVKSDESEPGDILYYHAETCMTHPGAERHETEGGPIHKPTTTSLADVCFSVKLVMILPNYLKGYIAKFYIYISNI